MKEYTKVNVSVRRDYVGDWRATARAILDPLQPLNVEIYPFGFRFIFDYYPEDIEQMRALLKAQGIDTSVTVKREYTPEELLAAEFLNLGTDAVVNSVPGTLQWDLVPLCPYCGFQEIRWSFQKLDIREAPKGYQLAMVDWHPVVVSAPLADAMRMTNFTGLELVPVGEDNIPAWYALRATHMLPPMESPPTRLHRSPGATPLCDRSHNWGLPRSEFYYPHKSFKALDFNYTYEVFGSSGSAERATVISNRVYRLLVELGVGQLVCEPIRFVK